MKKNIFVYLIATFTLLFSSCLNTETEITLNKNGSGTYMLTKDFSETINMLSALGSDSNDKLDSLKLAIQNDGIQQSIKAGVFPGISNVIDYKTEEYVSKFSVDFASLDALNSFLAALDGDTNTLNSDMEEVKSYWAYKMKGKKFIVEKISLGKEEKEEEEENENNLGVDIKEMMKETLASFNQKTIVHFPRNIKKIYSDYGFQEADGKTVVVSVPLDVTMDDAKAAEFCVKLK